MKLDHAEMLFAMQEKDYLRIGKIMARHFGVAGLERCTSVVAPRMLEAFRAEDGPAGYAILQEHFGVKLPDLVPVIIKNCDARPEIYAWAGECMYSWDPARGFRLLPLRGAAAEGLDNIYHGRRCVMCLCLKM